MKLAQAVEECKVLISLRSTLSIKEYCLMAEFIPGTPGTSTLADTFKFGPPETSQRQAANSSSMGRPNADMHAICSAQLIAWLPWQVPNEVYLRGGIVRFWAGLRPASRHLRACMTKCLTPERSETVLMKWHSSLYESTSSTPAAQATFASAHTLSCCASCTLVVGHHSSCQHVTIKIWVCRWPLRGVFLL